MTGGDTGGAWFVAMLFAVVSVVTSFERLRRVKRAMLFDVASLARSLGRGGGPARLREMRELMLLEGGTCWESDLLSAVLDARTPAERTALINEQLGDVESALRWGSRIPVVAARLSIVGPLCVMFFVLAKGGAPLDAIVPVIAWGGAGVVGSLAIGREADRAAADMRNGIDAWVGRVVDTAGAPESP